MNSIRETWYFFDLGDKDKWKGNGKNDPKNKKIWRDISSSDWSFRRNMYIMENKELGVGSVKKRVALDKNKLEKQKNKRDILHH